MADKRVSDLPRIGAVAGGSLFAVEQNGTAYSATGAQVAAMSGGSGGSGGGSGGESILLIDLAETVEIDSAIEDIPNRGQTVDVTVDTDAILAHTGRIDITYSDVRFPGEVQRATFTSRRTDFSATGSDTELMLFAAFVNPWTEDIGMIRLSIAADGTAVFLYRARAAEQADAAEDDEYAGSYIKNNPVKVESGYTKVYDLPKAKKIQFGTNTVTVTMDDGSTDTLTFTKDSSGNITQITDSSGHVTEVS